MELLTALIGGGAGLAAVSGLALKHALRPLKPVGVPVIRYRLVGPPFAGSPLNPLRVSEPTFREHIRYMARRGFRTVSLGEAIRRCGESDFLREKPVVLTFDGGYQGLERYVLPVLDEYEFAAGTVFVAPESLGGTNAYELDGHGRAEPMLSEEGLAGLAAFGMEIGSLGFSGRDLTRLGPEDFLRELQESRRVLKELTGQPVELLAWPRDLHAKDFGALVRQAGFTHAAWVSLDGLLSKDFDPLCVPRYGLTRRSALIEVALLLSLRLR